MLLIITKLTKSFTISINNNRNAFSKYTNRNIRGITTVNAQGDRKDEKKKTYTKSNLPSKICLVCNRPFEYRKKWEKVWDEVKYCSDKCRGQRNSNSNKNIDQKSLNNLPLSRSRSMSAIINKSAMK